MFKSGIPFFLLSIIITGVVAASNITLKAEELCNYEFVDGEATPFELPARRWRSRPSPKVERVIYNDRAINFEKKQGSKKVKPYLWFTIPAAENISNKPIQVETSLPWTNKKDEVYNSVFAVDEAGIYCVQLTFPDSLTSPVTMHAKVLRTANPSDELAICFAILKNAPALVACERKVKLTDPRLAAYVDNIPNIIKKHLEGEEAHKEAIKCMHFLAAKNKPISQTLDTETGVIMILRDYEFLSKNIDLFFSLKSKRKNNREFAKYENLRNKTRGPREKLGLLIENFLRDERGDQNKRFLTLTKIIKFIKDYDTKPRENLILIRKIKCKVKPENESKTIRPEGEGEKIILLSKNIRNLIKSYLPTILHGINAYLESSTNITQDQHAFWNRAIEAVQ